MYMYARYVRRSLVALGTWWSFSWLGQKVKDKYAQFTPTKSTTLRHSVDKMV